MVFLTLQDMEIIGISLRIVSVALKPLLKSLKYSADVWRISPRTSSKLSVKQETGIQSIWVAAPKFNPSLTRNYLKKDQKSTSRVTKDPRKITTMAIMSLATDFIALLFILSFTYHKYISNLHKEKKN